MLGWLFRKKKSPNQGEIPALWDIAQHVLRTAGAVRDDVVAARNGNPTIQTQAIDSHEISKYQANSSAGVSYLMLGQLHGQNISFNDMESLFFYQSDVNLFGSIFASEEMSASYFGPDNSSDMELRFERFLIRSLAIATNFTFAAAVLNKGYYAKLLDGSFSSGEIDDYRSLVTLVAEEFTGKIAMSRAASLNPERFDQLLPNCYSEQFNPRPITIQYDAKACRLLNGIWFTSEMVQQMTDYMAELQVK